MQEVPRSAGAGRRLHLLQPGEPPLHIQEMRCVVFRLALAVLVLVWSGLEERSHWKTSDVRVPQIRHQDMHLT